MGRGGHPGQPTGRGACGERPPRGAAGFYRGARRAPSPGPALGAARCPPPGPWGRVPAAALPPAPRQPPDRKARKRAFKALRPPRTPGAQPRGFLAPQPLPSPSPADGTEGDLGARPGATGGGGVRGEARGGRLGGGGEGAAAVLARRRESGAERWLPSAPFVLGRKRVSEGEREVPVLN